MCSFVILRVFSVIFPGTFFGTRCARGSAVDIIEYWPWPLLFQRGNLLPQRQILDQEFLASAKDGSERMDAEFHQEDE